MDARKKELKNKYKEMKPEMGVFVVRNKQSNKCFLDVSSDLKSMFNRIRFQLILGGHPNQELQKEWNAQGENNFEFEVIDRLEYSQDETKIDYRDDLNTLKSMWCEFYRIYTNRCEPTSLLSLKSTLIYRYCLK